MNARKVTRVTALSQHLGDAPFYPQYQGVESLARFAGGKPGVIMLPCRLRRPV